MQGPASHGLPATARLYSTIIKVSRQRISDWVGRLGCEGEFFFVGETGDCIRLIVEDRDDLVEAGDTQRLPNSVGCTGERDLAVLLADAEQDANQAAQAGAVYVVHVVHADHYLPLATFEQTQNSAREPQAGILVHIPAEINDRNTASPANLNFKLLGMIQHTAKQERRFGQLIILFLKGLKSEYTLYFRQIWGWTQGLSFKPGSSAGKPPAQSEGYRGTHWFSLASFRVFPRRAHITVADGG